MILLLRRIALLGLSFFLAGAVEAQVGSVLEPGARVRATVPSDVLPPEGGEFIGTLVSVGDTLAIQIGSGSVVRLAPDMLVRLDVSEGKPRLPYWMPVVGAGVGLAASIPLARAWIEEVPPRSPFGPPRLASNWKLQRGAIIVAGTAVGLVLGGVVATAQSRERWRPERRIRVAANSNAVVLRISL